MNDFAALDGVFGEKDCELGSSRLISWFFGCFVGKRSEIVVVRLW